MRIHINFRIFTDFLPKNFTKSVVNVLFGEILHKKKLSKHLKTQILFTLVISSLFLTTFLLQSIKTLSRVEEKWKEKKREQIYWENVAKKQPDFPDAYYQASWYSYILGERQKAFDYINKALLLHPTFKEAIELKNILLK